MGIFQGKYTYKIPERLTPSEIRQRRLFSDFQRMRKELEDQPSRLSPANKTHVTRLKEFEAKFGAEIESRRARVEQAAKRDPSIVRSRTYQAALSKLLQLQQRRSALLQRAAAERRTQARNKATAVDRRLYNPTKSQSPRTIYGTEAWVKQSADAVTRRLFVNPFLAIPCVQRAVRREVIFAKGHGGKGHKGKRRFSVLSHIGC